jgi:ribonuclease BN (tRNA processing enzyme)
MKIKILPSAFGDANNCQYVTTYLINDKVAVDAGCLGLYGNPENQRRVSHVFVTHSHADHVGTLPIFIETVCAAGGGSVTVYGHSDTLHTLAADVFNNRLWPDYNRIPRDERPNVEFEPIEAENTVAVGDLRVTPVLVNHSVTAFGFIVHDNSGAVVLGGDSGPTDRIWELAAQRADLKAAFIETSFPDELATMAKRSGHLTPALLREEIEKLPPGTAVFVTHIKPAYRERIVEQIKLFDHPRVTIGAADMTYDI